MKIRVFAMTIVCAGLMCFAMANRTTAGQDAKKDVVDTAVEAGSFKTLVTAIKAADLVETLKGKGPFTVFAPTDEAFAKVPKETLDALLKDKKALAGVLTYHVVAALPEGFPDPTPAGEIQIKRYPAYRLARSKMSGADSVAFWTLFLHIKKNEIAMTAPVEMTYAESMAWVLRKSPARNVLLFGSALAKRATFATPSFARSCR